MCGVYAAVFITLSLLRHNAFFTARFDLGNLTQAVWSLANGNGFVVTDPAGDQISRLGGHVEPILVVIAPLWKLWPAAEMLLVVQALAVATMAVPAYLLARRWLGDPRLSVAFAAASLLLPAVQWATLFDFHPVTLAAPLILWAIWAIVTDRLVLFWVFSLAALMTKENVGLALAVLGVWIAIRERRRVIGAMLSALSLAWTFVAVTVVIPHFRSGAESPFLEERYGALGSSVGEVLRSVVTRPWDAIGQMISDDRILYLAATILPLLVLPLAAPLLAAGALPDLVLNLLSSRPEQHAIEYHYGAVIAPFLIAAAIRGTAALRDRVPTRTRRLATPSRVAAALLTAVIVGGYLVGPLPFWKYLPGGADTKEEEYRSARAPLLAYAVAQIPDDAVVSAGNRIGGHLSARRRILTFPVIADADYVIVDEQRGDMGDELKPAEHAIAVRQLRADPAFQVIFDRQGVVIARRRDVA